MTIKHLVLGGGGIGGYAIYGALKYLSKNNYFDIKNIKSIYSTSAGALIGVLISLDYDWESLDDYLIKRPWDKVISIKPINILNLWNEKGLFDAEEIFGVILKKLLTAKGLSETITLKEYYNYNNIEIHIYSVNINNKLPIKVDFSYKTHPDLELCKVVALSCLVPIIFNPIFYNSECYIDGGILNNFPLDNCIDNIKELGDNINEILAFKISVIKQNDIITNKSNMLDYLLYLTYKILWLISPENNQSDISNIVYCNIEDNFSFSSKALISEVVRKDMIDSGIKYGEDYLIKIMESPQIISDEATLEK